MSSWVKEKIFCFWSEWSCYKGWRNVTDLCVTVDTITASSYSAHILSVWKYPGFCFNRAPSQRCWYKYLFSVYKDRLNLPKSRLLSCWVWMGIKWSIFVLYVRDRWLSLSFLVWVYHISSMLFFGFCLSGFAFIKQSWSWWHWSAFGLHMSVWFTSKWSLILLSIFK